MHSRPDVGFLFFFNSACAGSRGGGPVSVMGGLPAMLPAYRNIYIGIGGDTTMPMMEDSSARSAMLIRDD
jgi:hypothetical protein